MCVKPCGRLYAARSRSLPRSVMIRYAVSLASVSGSPQPLDPAEIRLLRDEINAAVDVPTYWELEARTVEKG